MNFLVTQTIKVEDKATKIFERIAMAQAKFHNNTTQSTRALKDFQKTADTVQKTNTQLKKTTNLMSKYGQSLKSELLGISRYFLGFYALKNIHESLMESSKALAKIQNNTHASIEEIKQFEKALQKASKVGTSSYTELYNASLQMSKLIPNINQLDKAISPFNLFVSGITDTSAIEDKANVFAKALNIFKEDASKTADILTKSMDVGGLSINDWTLILQNAGFATANFKGKLEDLAGIMAYLNKQGIGAANSSTAWKYIMTRMQAPRTMEMNRFLGIKKEDFDPSDPIKYINLLAEKTKHLNLNTKVGMFGKTFGEAYGGVMISLINNVDLLNKSLEKTKENSGFAQKSANNMLTTYAGATKQLEVALGGFAQTMRELEPEMVAIIKVITAFINAINYMFKGIIKLTGGIAKEFLTIDTNRMQQAENKTMYPQKVKSNWNDVLKNIKKEEGMQYLNQNQIQPKEMLLMKNIAEKLETPLQQTKIDSNITLQLQVENKASKDLRFNVDVLNSKNRENNNDLYSKPKIDLKLQNFNTY